MYHIFLLYVDKSSGFIWCGRFVHQTTANAVKLVKDIIHGFGRPKIITTDSGPAFRNEFSQILKSLFIEHTLSPAYMPDRNGRAERNDAVFQHMLEWNVGVNDLGIADPVQACN